MSCKKGGYVYIRHNGKYDVRSVQGTKIEPKLTPLSGEELQDRMSNNSNEARVDIRTRGFRERGQQALFDFFWFLTRTPVVIALSPYSSAML